MTLPATPSAVHDGASRVGNARPPMTATNEAPKIHEHGTRRYGGVLFVVVEPSHPLPLFLSPARCQGLLFVAAEFSPDRRKADFTTALLVTARGAGLADGIVASLRREATPARPGYGKRLLYPLARLPKPLVEGDYATRERGSSMRAAVVPPTAPPTLV